MNQHRTAQAGVVWASMFAGLAFVVLAAAPASANTRCSRAMIFTTPGVTWNDVERYKPPTLLSLAQAGAVGSMSVHTDVSRPSYSSAFITMGAGARMPGLDLRESIRPGPPNRSLAQDTRVASVSDLRDLSQRSGYGARAGALARSLQTPVVAIGDAASSMGSSETFAQWPLLAAMDPSGHVQYSATNTLASASSGVIADRAAVVRMTREALSLPCATVVIDVGDLERAEQRVDRARAFPEALIRTDRILHEVSGFLDLRRDLLLVISPTSPPAHTHLGIAIAAGPEFGAGNQLESASTRRAGIVTAPDVAPTVLAHMLVAQPRVMNGQPFFDVPGAADPVAAASELDRKAVFIDAAKPAMSWVLLGAELALFAAALIVMWFRHRNAAPILSLAAELVNILALIVAALPVGTFVANLFSDVGLGQFGFIALCLSLSLGAVLLALFLRRSWLQRLGLISGLSLLVIVLDLVTGAHLQLNSLLGDSPLIAGRFAGAGNNAFAILAATGVVVGTLLVWRLERTGGVLVGVMILFAIIVVVDGAPQFGSDVGGVLALVPGFALTWFLLSGKRISAKAVAVGLLGAILAAGTFIAVDVSRPPEQRTHLGRFFEDIRSRGGSAFTETVRRKAASNLRQARSFQNLYRFLPAMLATLFFLFWPRRWWTWLGSREPVLRAGLVAALIVGLLGSALNDSGISIFTTMLLFVAPMAILVRLGSPERSTATGERSWNR